ncbi:MAG: sigma-70 family RNA polymerase sigma factor [Micrococcales bacterium]|nr:sigma-70 family RNA polymerase sigma factor [Micrococcales bacterium]
MHFERLLTVSMQQLTRVYRREMTKDSDLEELVAAAAAGSQDAWTVIVDRFSSLLWSVARAHRLSTEDAADVVQNTWLRLVDNLDTIQRRAALAGWLATTARNEALSMLRRRSRDVPTREEDLGPMVTDAEALALDTALLDEERDAQLWSCYTRLSERCQRLLRVLMACDRPSYEQVSATLDIPVGSIGPTRSRCLDRLRGIIADGGYTVGMWEEMGR